LRQDGKIKKTGRDFYWLESFEVKPAGGEIRTLRRLHISKKIRRALSIATNIDFKS
jgi:hypothetical protein